MIGPDGNICRLISPTAKPAMRCVYKRDFCNIHCVAISLVDLPGEPLGLACYAPVKPMSLGALDESVIDLDLIEALRAGKKYRDSLHYTLSKSVGSDDI